MTDNEQLKKALRDAILDTRRATKRIIDSDPAGSTYALDWTEETKEWANLCGLDLTKYSPFHFL